MTENGIDIYSKGEYPADVLSNFYPNSFVIDGVKCASMEGFLQALKYKDLNEQTRVCSLVGNEAKNAGGQRKLWKLTGFLYWQGKRYFRESKKFDELRRRAYEAMFENQTFKEALQSVKGKVLDHSIGKRCKRVTVLTKKEFLNYLYELIEKL